MAPNQLSRMAAVESQCGHRTSSGFRPRIWTSPLIPSGISSLVTFVGPGAETLDLLVDWALDRSTLATEGERATLISFWSGLGQRGYTMSERHRSRIRLIAEARHGRLDTSTLMVYEILSSIKEAHQDEHVAATMDHALTTTKSWIMWNRI